MARGSQNIFRDAFVVSSLLTAWAKVRRNDGCAGGDGISTERFAHNARHNVTALSAAILGGTYAPRDLRQLSIPKRSGGLRGLAIPSVSDRIAQTAAATALTPVLEPLFNRYSFGYRPGRSVIQAVRVIEGLRRRGFTHVVEADIHRCFDTIPHDGLMTALDDALSDTPGAVELAEVVGLWLEQFGAVLGTPGRGLAQGSPLAPLLSNLFLDRLDDAFEQKGLALVRFADDFVILCRSESAARAALDKAGAFLRDHGLELAAGKTRVVDFDRGFAFLGHLFVRSMVLKTARRDDDPDPLGAFREQARLDADALADAEVTAQALIRAEAAGLDAAARVLHLIEPGRRLARRNLSFVVESPEGRELIAVAHARVDRIELGPDAETDLDTIRHALATDTELALTDRRGETLGLLSRPPDDSAARHLAQARAILDPGQATALTRAIVAARLHNQRARLRILNRKPDDPEVARAVVAINAELRKLAGAADIDALRGHEGRAGALYWPALARLCKGASQPFRRQRPARDPLNGAINYLTALLAHDIRSAMLARGLHPGFGVLHATQDRRDAGVYDLMEGWRALLSEGLAVGLFNQRRLRGEMFERGRAGLRISTEGRRALIRGYESACGRAVRSPYSGHRRKLRWLMREEAAALVTALRDGNPGDFAPYRQDY